MPSYIFSKDLYPDQLYTELQSRILVNLQRVSGSLSILGSSTIIFIVLQDWQRKKKRVYHRILFVYSLVDVVVSFNHCLSSLVVPEGTPAVFGAAGNVATCEASGFILQFSTTLAMYGSFICLYYTLILRYQVKEETIAKRIEPCAHAFSLLVPLAIASIALTNDSFNPSIILPGWCVGGRYPARCSNQEDLECDRRGSPLVSILNAAAFTIYCSVAIVCSILTFLKVREVQLRGARWATSQRPSRARVRDAGVQSCLYVSSFVVTYSYGITSLFGPTPATMDNRGFYLPLAVVGKIVLPLQGFWNFFIYVRPRFVALRRRNPEMPWRLVAHNILYAKECGTFISVAVPRRRSSLLAAYGGFAAWNPFTTTNSKQQQPEPPSVAPVVRIESSTFPPAGRAEGPLDVGGDCELVGGDRDCELNNNNDDKDEFLPELDVTSSSPASSSSSSPPGTGSTTADPTVKGDL